LTDAFPEGNALSKAYNEAKNLLKELGLGYELIHACCNNCVVFRKRYAHLDKCPVCGLSRWKDEERKKIPQNVLMHFSLAPRLKRLFATKEASLLAQWHDRQRQPSEKEMIHQLMVMHGKISTKNIRNSLEMQETSVLALLMTGSTHF
jgi:hypothetical protein